jgi:hypothetical protein
MDASAAESAATGEESPSASDEERRRHSRKHRSKKQLRRAEQAAGADEPGIRSRSSGEHAKACKEYLLRRLLSPAWAYARHLSSDLRSGLNSAAELLLQQWCHDNGISGSQAFDVEREVEPWVRARICCERFLDC